VNYRSSSPPALARVRHRSPAQIKPRARASPNLDGRSPRRRRAAREILTPRAAIAARLPTAKRLSRSAEEIQGGVVEEPMASEAQAGWPHVVSTALPALRPWECLDRFVVPNEWHCRCGGRLEHLSGSLNGPYVSPSPLSSWTWVERTKASSSGGNSTGRSRSAFAIPRRLLRLRRAPSEISTPSSRSSATC
jgi:hypothetical protein